ncbi:hypothetical protein [Ottowia sp.]|uniref:hypothetical protein n=1 Tax=Ottowia sp. TaxID=1898956 RepID=UPI0026015FA5|nr:hypothetical protein [Ottowia sp.]MBK6616215.1 hypothetical protein [Ottowia sp.]
MSEHNADAYRVMALYWISRFGWLRSREIGQLLLATPVTLDGVPHTGPAIDDAQRKFTHRVLHRLLADKQIIPRLLPKSAGTAYVLSAAGARYLAKQDSTLRPRAGDTWGRSVAGVWSAPNSWEHELLCCILLIYFHQSGYKILTEVELRAQNPRMIKYPDGFVIDTRGTAPKVFWVEVESATKKGRKMMRLAQYLTMVQRGDAPVMSGIKADKAFVAFRTDILDTSGARIDHLNRVKAALSRHIGAPLRLAFFEVSVRNAQYHLDAVVRRVETVFPIGADDPNVHKLFTCTRTGLYQCDRFDIHGRRWLLQVSIIHDHYSWQIFDPHGKETRSYVDRSKESCFRYVVDTFNTEFYERPLSDVEIASFAQAATVQ